MTKFITLLIKIIIIKTVIIMHSRMHKRFTKQQREKMRQFQLSCKDRPLSFDFFQTQANSQKSGLSILVTHNTIQLYKHSSDYNREKNVVESDMDIVKSK